MTPMELTTKMLAASLAAGSELIIDSVIGVVTAAKGSDVGTNAVTGLKLAQRGELMSSRIVFAMGPWTGALLEQWLPGVSFPMEGIKSTSVVYENFNELKIEENCFAYFCDEDRNGCHLELYPRPNGDLYVCGCGGSDYVSGDRLLPGGDCEHADLIDADIRRVHAAHDSLLQLALPRSAPAAPGITQIF